MMNPLRLFIPLIIVLVTTVLFRIECSSHRINTPSTQQEKVMRKKEVWQERRSAREERKKQRRAEKRERYKSASLLKKSPKQMNIDELQIAKKYALEHELYDNASKIIERAIFVKGDKHQDEEVRTLRLELADTYFEQGDFKRADTLYEEYITLYPGCDKEQTEYVEYKKILCRFYACLKPAVDQSKTRKTIEVTSSYLNKGTIYTKYVDEVQKIQNTCYDRIFTHEADILTFYSKRGQKAEARLRDLKKEFQPVMKQFEHRIIDLEITLAQLEGNTAVVVAKQEELSSKFPTYTATMAQLKTKKSHADRF